jgi:hypothetical protein
VEKGSQTGVLNKNTFLNMENDASDGRKRRYELRRSILDYGMGAIIFGFGVFLLIAPKLGVNLVLDDFFRYTFSGLWLLYGGWRIYRGYKKNYYR